MIVRIILHQANPVNPLDIQTNLCYSRNSRTFIYDSYHIKSFTYSSLVQSTTFAERYVTSIRWRLFDWREHGEVEVQGPLLAYYPIDNPKRCAQINCFD